MALPALGAGSTGGRDAGADGAAGPSGPGVLPPKGGGAWWPQGSAGCQPGNGDVPKKPTPHQRATPPPSSRGQRSRRELGMGHGVHLAAGGTRVGGQALAHSRCAQGRWPLARGLQLSLGRGLWKAKNGLCSPRARLFPPSPCPGTLHPRGDFGEGSPPDTHTPPRAAGGGGRRDATITDTSSS